MVQEYGILFGIKGTDRKPFPWETEHQSSSFQISSMEQIFGIGSLLSYQFASESAASVHLVVSANEKTVSFPRTRIEFL